MTITLEQNGYGESHIGVLRVMRRGSFHEVKDLDVSVRFEGDFDSAHTGGDNRNILPADTVKNTVHVLARQYPAESIEEFALHVIEHFLTYNEQISRVNVSVRERPWSRIPVGDKPQATAFIASASEKRTTQIMATRGKMILQSGIEDLMAMRTTSFSFEDFRRDPYTTLPGTSERIFATSINAAWLYEIAEPDLPFSTMWHSARKLLLETFAAHESRSPQHMLYAMGQAVLDNLEAIAEIRLALTDNHYSLVDLKPFGMENENEVFSTADATHGTVEATLRREDDNHRGTV
ncbi:MAG: urate oxidase [Candidatus Acidiferrales bacterium]